MIRRIVNKGELPLLLPLAEQDAAAVGYSLSDINYEKLLQSFEACVDHAAVFVADHNDEIAGMMTLCLIESFWSDRRTLTNLIYWVDPKYRKSQAGMGLLRAACDYAKQTGLRFDLRVESYDELDRKDKLFRHMGFKPTGSNYYYGGQ